jgi:hypothetical protein
MGTVRCRSFHARLQLPRSVLRARSLCSQRRFKEVGVGIGTPEAGGDAHAQCDHIINSAPKKSASLPALESRPFNDRLVVVTMDDVR